MTAPDDDERCFKKMMNAWGEGPYVSHCHSNYRSAPIEYSQKMKRKHWLVFFCSASLEPTPALEASTSGHRWPVARGRMRRSVRCAAAKPWTRCRLLELHLQAELRLCKRRIVQGLTLVTERNRRRGQAGPNHRSLDGAGVGAIRLHRQRLVDHHLRAAEDGPALDISAPTDADS